MKTRDQGSKKLTVKLTDTATLTSTEIQHIQTICDLMYEMGRLKMDRPAHFRLELETYTTVAEDVYAERGYQNELKALAKREIP